MKLSAVGKIMGLVSTLGILTTLQVQFVSAAPWIGSPLTQDFDIQSGNGSGYLVCDPNCHLSGNSGGSRSINDAQPGYRLNIDVPSHPSGTSTVDISITTENGYTDQANVPTAGGTTYTFNVPANQGNSVKVCVKPENVSVNNCHKYKATGSDISVSLPALSSTGPSTSHYRIGPWSGWGGYGTYFPGYNGFYGYP